MSADYGVIDAIYDSFNGNFVPKEVKLERRAICEPCENNNGIQCTICDCIIKWATAMPGKSCPIGKWSEWKNKK